MALMNKQQFVREASTSLLNARSIEKGSPPPPKDWMEESLRKLNDKAMRDQTEDWLKQLFEVLDQDGFFIGRKGMRFD